MTTLNVNQEIYLTSIAWQLLKDNYLLIKKESNVLLVKAPRSEEVYILFQVVIDPATKTFDTNKSVCGDLEVALASFDLLKEGKI